MAYATVMEAAVGYQIPSTSQSFDERALTASARSSDHGEQNLGAVPLAYPSDVEVADARGTEISTLLGFEATAPCADRLVSPSIGRGHNQAAKHK